MKRGISANTAPRWKITFTIMTTRVQRYPHGDLYTALSPILLPFLLSLGEPSW